MTIQTVVLAVAAAFLLLGCGDKTESTRTESLAAWDQVEEVLVHPRCLNCHQEESPLQGDDPHAHVPLVVRGPGNHGVTAMRCGNCHNEIGNNETSGVPGAPHWQLSPASMVWQGLTSQELCESLMDPARNGSRSPLDLITHMSSDALVLWGWKPGQGREPVHIPHDQFVAILTTWVETGAHCPSS